MQLMSRYIETQNKNLIRWKCKLRQLIGLTFPEYEDIYKDEKLFTENALNFIKTYPHATLIKETAKKSLSTVSKDSIATYQLSELAGEIIRLQKIVNANREQLVKMAIDEKIFHVYMPF